MAPYSPVVSRAGLVTEEVAKRFNDKIAPKILMWRHYRGPLIEQMMRVQERYDGNWVMPELGDQARPLTPTLLNDVIDGLADRAASVMPRTNCPPLNPAKLGGGKGSADFAMRRRQALGYTWHESKWLLAAGRAFRHLFGYGNANLTVIPDMAAGFPRIVVRDPLHTLPEPKAPEDLTPPSCIAYIYGKSREWIAATYPEAKDHLGNETLHSSGLWDLIEYVDEDSIYIGLLGPRDDLLVRTAGSDHMKPLCLRRWDNRAGRCTGYQLEAVTLSKIGSQLFHLTGHSDLLARLTALDIMASEQALLPDRYIIGAPNMTPRIVGGEWKRGVTGQANLLEDTAAVGQLSSAPDPNNRATREALESAFMRSSGMIGPMAGITSGMSGQLRTGRGIDTLASVSVDPRIATAHHVMAAAMKHVNEIVLDTYKGYWRRRKYEVFSGWSSDQGQVEFTPATHFETTANAVTYAIPGADAQNLTVALGGLVGTELISKDTARELHPWIANPEGEERKRVGEDLLRAMLEMILTDATNPQGGMQAIDVAEIYEQYMKDGHLAKAIKKAQEIAQERQAALAPEPEEGQLAAPEAMPGLANPGMGAEQPEPTPTIGPVAPSLDNLRRLNSALIGSVNPRR